MTNKEFLIAALNDEIDDGGASRESVIHYRIECPYSYGDKRSKCFSTGIPSRELCVDCKEDWLESEVDD